MPAPELPQGACRNCGAPANLNFCPQCGQATRLHPPSVLEFVHEVVSHYVAAEGKLWRTLALLALQPGRLTVEYLSGRRQRYIVPLRLYLTASFLFFAVAQLGSHAARIEVVRLGSAPGATAGRPAEPPPAPKTGSPSVAPPGAKEGGAPETNEDAAVAVLSEKDVAAALEREHFADCLQPGSQCSWWKRRVAPGMVRLQRDPQGVIERFTERWRHSLSYAMFCLLPIFASLLALAYRNRHLNYGEHLVFALHVHSFWFLLALATGLLPESVGAWFPAIAAIYGTWALHRVYRGRWWTTVLRAFAVTTSYSLIMGVGAAALSIGLLAT
ncbi:MAG TPA: DUF3667 domain-containing protein [Burkholderiaceae bacterium]|nr:DUF3667 domain-containing protein [Burkholderiaceae bacterium]